MVMVDDSVDLFLFFLLLSTTEYTGISGVYGQDVQLHTYIHNKTWIYNAMGCVYKTSVHEYQH